MSNPGYQHLYGPVPSRRLGSSLGVDIIPPKICSYDCIYCQLGRTTTKTIKREQYVPVDDVLNEVERKLTEKQKPHYISLAGSGEPTLNSGIGTLIKGIKSLTDIPVTVLTNGSLLWMDEVKADLMDADIVLPSLDAGDAPQLRKVNRPHIEVPYMKMVDGIVDFTREFSGEVWLEVVLIGGVTDTEPEVLKIVAQAERISPKRIQLNTVCRPPAELFALAVPQESMIQMKNLFPGEVDIISSAEAGDPSSVVLLEAREEDILDLISRRPCTASDVANGLGIHLAESIKHLQALIVSGKAVIEITGGRSFYRLDDRNKNVSPSGKDQRK
jgi:wyosine [tRNA(Phe)-imidazoG37] synthetase (radical SAM superfamily)